MSLVEVCLALLLVVVIAVPLIEALNTLRLGLHTSSRREDALYLGQAILEEVQYLLYSQSAKDGAATQEISRDMRVQAFFASLSEKGATVVAGRDGGVSRYFARMENLTGQAFHPITAEFNPEVFGTLQDVTCSIEVVSPAPPTGSGAAPDPDLAELSVTIEYSGGRNLSRRRSLTLHTIVRSSMPVDDWALGDKGGS